MASEDPVYLSPGEYAALMRVNADTVRRLIKEGRLEVVKVGGQYRIPRPTPGPPPTMKNWAASSQRRNA